LPLRIRGERGDAGEEVGKNLVRHTDLAVACARLLQGQSYVMSCGPDDEFPRRNRSKRAHAVADTQFLCLHHERSLEAVGPLASHYEVDVII
jgi:N-acetyl-gamma-glutamylphosphate reductase